MHAALAFGLLVLVAYLGSRFFTKRKRLLDPITFFFVSGFVYILLGAYLGEAGTGVLDAEVLKGLMPLLALGLGWIGFLFGFQLEAKYLRRFPRRYVGLSFFHVGLVVVLVFGALFLSSGTGLKALALAHEYGFALAFALLLSLSSPTLLNAASLAISSRDSYFYLARFLSSVNGFWGILGLGVLSCFWHFPVFESRAFSHGVIMFLGATLIPGALGFVFHHLTKKKTGEQDVLVYLLGLVFFVSGAAFYFNLAPLFSGLVMGITYSNLTKIHEKLYPLLLSTEKPLFIIFLILIGSKWDLSSSSGIALLVFTLVILQIVVHMIPFPLFRRIFGFELPLSPRFGLNFLSSGGLGIAFAVSLTMVRPTPETDLFLSVALSVIILSEFLGPWALKVSLVGLDKEKRS